MEGYLSDETQPTWLVQWDRRFRALGDNCGRLESARIDLKSLRDKYELLLVDFRRQQIPLVKRIERELDN